MQHLLYIAEQSSSLLFEDQLCEIQSIMTKHIQVWSTDKNENKSKEHSWGTRYQGLHRVFLYQENSHVVDVGDVTAGGCTAMLLNILLMVSMH